MVPNAVRQRYQELEPLLERLAQRVRETVLGYCERANFAYAGRVKSVESVAEKLESGRVRAWSELDDLFACAVVVPDLTCEPEVVDFLRSAFGEQKSRTCLRGSRQKQPDVFRFDLTRFVGRLRPPPGSSEEDVHRISFEVQVRSAYEHAWCVSIHSRLYKGTKDWKRARLAAGLKATVEQADLALLAFDELAASVKRSADPRIDAEAAVVKRLQAWTEEGRIPAEMAPGAWSRLGANLVSLFLSSSGLSDENRGHPKRLVQRAMGALEAALAKSPPQRSLSLAQGALGVLAQSELLEPPLRDYTPLITPELVEWFPSAEGFVERVDLDA